MEKADIIVIGAGVVGLGIAAKISKPVINMYVLERHCSFGQEISSRNSEVIHSGIYYPSWSLKAKLCVRGNQMLYELCSRHKIPHKRIEKLIVANNDEEERKLITLLHTGQNNGASGLKIINKTEIYKLEPNIKAHAALYSPSTGIIDTHTLMKYFVNRIKENKGEVAYNSKIIGLKKDSSGYAITVSDNDRNTFTFHAKIVINCAGIDSDKIAAMLGIDLEKEKYVLKYCKGQYFRVTSSKKCDLINRLIYPVPHEKASGLGVHATKDLAGGLRLGPDAHYVNKNSFDLTVNLNEKKNFLNSAISFLPFLAEEDLTADTCGIRPKLQGENEGFRDFIIQEESALGFPGFINLIGIESPGLTSAPAIAEYVENIIKQVHL